jgi:hypothetical protein
MELKGRLTVTCPVLDLPRLYVLEQHHLGTHAQLEPLLGKEVVQLQRTKIFSR